MKIIEVRPDWHEGYDNMPTFQVLVSRKSKLNPEKAVYEERGTLYVAKDGVLLTHFSYNGKPNEGFGGWKRTVTMIDGSKREIIGGWYSDAHSINAMFPELLCVDGSSTNEREVWDRGHTFSGAQILLQPLVEWYVANQHKVDWSLYLFDTDHGPVVVPGKGHFVKPLHGMSYWRARLLPSPKAKRRKSKPLYSWEKPNAHRDYFMVKALDLWAASPKRVSNLSAAQQMAVSA
jgi:hypothetical protein